jgi:hypothetical protein
VATVEEFSREMVETYIANRNLSSVADEDGDYRFRFADDEGTGRRLEMWLLFGGPEKKILTVRFVTNKPIDKAVWGTALEICNDWNRDRRWPKAYFIVSGSDDSLGFILLEEDIDFATGVHQELLEDWIETIRLSAFQFWVWAHGERGL